MPFPHSPSGSLQVAGVSLEGAYKHVWHRSFCSCHPEDGPLDCLALVNSGACVPRPHRTVANQGTVLNQLLPTPSSRQGSVQREQTEIPIPSLSLKKA